MRRQSFPIALALFGLLTSCATNAWRELKNDLDSMIEATVGESGQVSAKIIALDTGEVVYERHPGLLMHPASTMKLVTVAAALRNGLSDKNVSTTLIGSPDGRGPLYLRGGGDPFFSTGDLRGMVDQLRQRGIGLVTGPLVVDASLFTGPRFGFGWMWDDEPASFMPHISALTVEGGCVHIVVSAEGMSADEGRPQVNVFPRSEHVRVANQATVSANGSQRESTVLIDRNWQSGGRTITVHGSLRPGQRTERRLSVPRPALFAGRVFKAYLEEEGICGNDLEVAAMEAGPSSAGASNELKGHVLARVQRPLDEVIIRLTKASDNLGAEYLLRLLAVHHGSRPAGVRKALDILHSYLRELGRDPQDYRLVDGSGLSHLNLLSADLIVAILEDMQRRKDTADLFMSSLPVAGVDGTLSRRMSGTTAENNLRAKTGTLSGVSAMAGYVRTAAGEPLAFAFLMQNFVGSPRPWRNLQDRMGARLTQ